MIPLALYATNTDGEEGEFLLQVIDDFRFPLTKELYFGIFDDECLRHCMERAADHGAQTCQFLTGLSQVQRIGRVWLTPAMLLIKGDSQSFQEVPEQVRSIMTEVFGPFDFGEIPHNEMNWLVTEVLGLEEKMKIA